MLTSRIEMKNRIEISNFNELPAFRVELKIFTGFIFKLVFRVSGRSVPWDIPLTSKRTGVHNLHVMFKSCL